MTGLLGGRAEHAQAAAFRTWYEQRAAILAPATLAPVDATAGARVEALLDAMADARVIVLGELNHWIAEKTRFRLWWLERLAARFSLVLAEELGHSDGVRVSRYLRSGDETWLDRVPTFGWQGDARSDRVDEPTGVLRESYARFPTQRVKQAQRGFYRELCRLGLLAFHGLDVNGTTGAGYADIAASVAAQAGCRSRSSSTCRCLRTRFGMRVSHTQHQAMKRWRQHSRGAKTC